uniref:Acylphosphatase-like domain-containing protein n=1 Tax=Steinernema glaseri TaxID=37863 RepID=A0A1I7Z0B2_9BILA
MWSSLYNLALLNPITAPGRLLAVFNICLLLLTAMHKLRHHQPVPSHGPTEEHRLEVLQESGEQLTLKAVVENVIDRNNLRSRHMSLFGWVKKAGTRTDANYDDIVLHGATYDMFTTVGAAANVVCFPSSEDGGSPVFPGN